MINANELPMWETNKIKNLNPMAFTKTPPEKSADVLKKIEWLSRTVVKSNKVGDTFSFGRLAAEFGLSLAGENRQVFFNYIGNFRRRLYRDGFDLVVNKKKQEYCLIPFGARTHKRPNKKAAPMVATTTQTAPESAAPAASTINRAFGLCDELDGKIGVIRFVDGTLFFVESQTAKLFKLS